MAQKPRCILADEPVASLDPELAAQVMDDLARVARDEGVPTLINIHAIELARAFCDRIVGIAQGVVVFDGHAGGAGRGGARPHLPLRPRSPAARSCRGSAERSERELVGAWVSSMAVFGRTLEDRAPKPRHRRPQGAAPAPLPRVGLKPLLHRPRRSRAYYWGVLGTRPRPAS